MKTTDFTKFSQNLYTVNGDAHTAELLSLNPERTKHIKPENQLNSLHSSHKDNEKIIQYKS